MYNNPPKAALFLNGPLFMALPFSGCATLVVDKIAIISSPALIFLFRVLLTHARE
jgi:hypothetical protein